MPEDENGEQSAAGSFWTGTLSFGLVSIPVTLAAANRSSHVGLRMLAPDGTPLRRRYFSTKTGKEVAPEDLVRTYPIEGQPVEITDEELDRLAPEKSHDIDLRLFVNEDEIPPLYFERGYFLAPGGESSKAYQLLAAVMEKTRRAGIATFVMRGKEYLVAIVSRNGILRAETMRFKDEVRSPQDAALPEKSHASPTEVQEFEKVIGKIAAPKLVREELRDETAEKLLEVVRKKQSQPKSVVKSSESRETEDASGAEPDVLTALKKSLEARGHGHETSRRHGRSAHGRPHPRGASADGPKPSPTVRRRSKQAA